MRAATCSSCKALIVWAVTAKGGKPIPIDAKPTRNGNIDLEPNNDAREPPIAHSLNATGERVVGVLKHSPNLRYQSHFVSCPNAAEHRK